MSRRWQAAVAEHDAVLAEFVDAVRAVAPEAWHQPMGAGGWTRAFRHVLRSLSEGALHPP
jgi:hypothetical protein